MRDYGKVYSTFWSSSTTTDLSDDSKLLALYLMTCSHSTIAGVFRLPDGYVSEDLSWGLARVQKGFAELLAKGFANRCETTKWVWVCKHLEWNKPENPNQRKSAAKIALSVPDSCAWKLDFMRVCAESLDILWEPSANPCETLAEGLLNQKQKQEQEQKQEKKEPKGSSSPAKLPTCKTQEVIDLYHQILPEMPGVRLHTKDRVKSIRKVWEWVLTSTKPDKTRRAETSEQALAWFESYFQRTRANDFLMGVTPRSGEHANWQCDLDFLLTERGMKQVIEKTKDTP